MSRILQRAIWGIEQLSLAGGALAAILLPAIAILMLLEIFMRSFVGVSLSFSWEYSAYSMATVFFLGAAYTLRAGGHVRVTLLYELLPGSVGRILEFIASLLGLIIAAYAAVAVSKLALMSMKLGTTSFTPTRTLLFVPQSLVAIGLILLTAQFVARLLRLAARVPLDQVTVKQDSVRDQ